MEFFLLASAHFMALLSPGPDFFLIMQTSLRMPLCFSLAVCCGIATANGIYITIAVLGLETIRNMTTLMTLLRYGGSAYLLYLGFLLLRAQPREIADNAPVNILLRKSLPGQFLVGLGSGLLNPKNILFYLTLFTVMVSPATSLGRRTLYGLWMVFLVMGWDMGLAAFLSGHDLQDRLGRWVYRLEKFAGLMLAFFGLSLIWK
jgi:threonine/homoserine/homoserine lactone efflux protein